MKKYASRFMRVIALFYLTFPVSYLIVAAVLFDVPTREFWEILFSPFFYILCFAAVVTGFGLWEMKRWVWYVYVLLQFFILYYSASVTFRLGETHHPVAAYLVFVFFLFVAFWRVRVELVVPYFLPNIRWWEVQSRNPIVVPVTVIRDDETFFVGELIDLSEKGCFIKLPDDLQADEKVQIRLDVFGQVTECRGTVVWKTASTVTRPKGIGVMFSRLSSQKIRRLSIARKRIDKLEDLYRKPKSERDAEEFVKYLRMMQESVGRDGTLHQ